MSKKKLSKREKRLLRELLEEEELLLDEFIPREKPKKAKPAPKLEEKLKETTKLLKKVKEGSELPKKAKEDEIPAETEQEVAAEEEDAPEEEGTDEAAPEQVEEKAPRKITKPEEELISQLLGEANKDYSAEDQQLIERLLTRVPKRKVPRPEPQRVNDDIMRIFPSEEVHKRDLETAFMKYPGVHRMRVIKLIFITILAGILVGLLAIKSGFFNMDAANSTINSTIQGFLTR